MPANSAPGENGNAGLYWYLPAMISEIEEIQRRGLDPHHGLSGPGHRVGQVADGRGRPGCRRGCRAGLSWPRGSRFYMDSRRPSRPVQSRPAPRLATIRSFHCRFCPLFRYTWTDCSVRAPPYARGPMRLTNRTDLPCRCLPRWRCRVCRRRGARRSAKPPANPDRPGHAARPVSATGAPIRRRPAARRSASRWRSRPRRSTTRRTAAPRPTRSICSSRRGRPRR